MSASANHYQVVIVGAGPAGSAAAIQFKQKKIRTALIDKAVFPRDKVCGDGIPLKTFKLLSELGFSEAELFRGGRLIKRMYVYSPAGDKTIIGGLQPDAGTKSGCIPRFFFDNMLFQKAAGMADAAFIGYKLILFNREGDCWRLTIKNAVSGEEKHLSADLLIGADGGNSMVARQSGLLAPDEKYRFDGLRIYYTGKKFEPAVHLFYDKLTLPGYVWIFPVAEERANVGIMINRRHKHESGKTIRQIFEEVLATNLQIREVLDGAQPMDKTRGAPLPLGVTRGERIADGLLLIGDAAAFINPISGGGIYFALLSAKMAAECGFAAFNAGGVSKNNLLPYEHWWRKSILPGFLYSDHLKKWFGSERFVNWFLRNTSRNRAFANFFIMVYGQPLAKFTFLNPLFWMRILFRR